MTLHNEAMTLQSFGGTGSFELRDVNTDLAGLPARLQRIDLKCEILRIFSSEQDAMLPETVFHITRPALPLLPDSLDQPVATPAWRGKSDANGCRVALHCISRRQGLRSTTFVKAY